MNDIKLSPLARKLLRQELRSHPKFANVSEGVDLNAANKNTLLALASKCGIDVEAVVKGARMGPDAKPRKASGQGVRHGATPSVSIDGHIPMEITVTVMGQSKTYEAFMAYEWSASFEEEEGDVTAAQGEGRYTLKVLTTATDEDFQQTGKMGAGASHDEHGPYFTEEPAPIMLSDPKLSRLIPPTVMDKLWDIIDDRALAEARRMKESG